MILLPVQRRRLRAANRFSLTPRASLCLLDMDSAFHIGLGRTQPHMRCRRKCEPAEFFTEFLMVSNLGSSVLKVGDVSTAFLSFTGMSHGG